MVVNCQVAGSAVPAFHAFAAKVVGFVPSAEKRMRMTSFAVVVRFGAWIDFRAVEAPPTTRSNSRLSLPPDTQTVLSK